jgi:uncharacterized lipoprotein
MNRKTYRTTVTALLLLILGGCSGMEPKSHRPMEGRVYDHRYDLVYRAVRTVLRTEGFPITAEDQAAGTVETDWMVKQYERSKVRAQIHSMARNRTNVMLGIQLEKKGVLGGDWKPAEVEMHTYTMLFEYIDLQIYHEYFREIEEPARQGKPSS